MSEAPERFDVGNYQYTHGQHGNLPEKCSAASYSYNYGRNTLYEAHSHDDYLYNNKGNPVFSCPAVLPSPAPHDYGQIESKEEYQRKPVHPMYRTTNTDYGANPPTIHTVPITFHAKSQTFSNQLGKCGMYRNRSLNTGMDTSSVPNH